MNRQISKPLIILAGLILALQLGACTGMLLGGGNTAGRPIGSSSAGQSEASDLQIEATIRARFNASSVLDGARLSVDSVGGVVTLRGSVPAYAARDHAERLAADVNGVDRVSNQIQISR